jgi:hypothetical protein
VIIPCCGSGPRCLASQRLGEDRLIVRHTAQITPGQWRVLDAVRRRGPLVFNNRARQGIGRLESLGLVTVDWDMRASAKGSGIELTGRNTVTAVGEGCACRAARPASPPRS